MNPIFDSGDEAIYTLRTTAPGPAGSLPLDAERLKGMASGELFGWTQNAGMGWSPAAMLGKQFLILSTQGGLRAPDGRPIALGYHTGHWEIGLLVEAAAGPVFVEPSSEAGPVPQQRLVGDLGDRLVDDHEAARDERVERGARVGIVVDAERRERDTAPNVDAVLLAREVEQDAASGALLRGGERVVTPVGHRRHHAFTAASDARISSSFCCGPG